jgi:large subunit ribosomal protein L4
MKLNVVDKSGKAKSEIEVSDIIFAAKFNESLIHQLVVASHAAKRQGTRAQKNRAAVRGGGAKPFAQKGTGRARAGTIRSPIWRGGGKVFPSQTANFTQKLNKKMRRAGLRSIFGELVRQERLVAIEDIKIDTPKTKTLAEKLAKLKASDVLILVSEQDKNLSLSARNLPNIGVCSVDELDPVSLIGYEKVLITQAAIKKCEELLA